MYVSFELNKINQKIVARKKEVSYLMKEEVKLSDEY
jgi:hypothetical protein